MGPDGDNSSTADTIRIPRRDGEDGMKIMEKEANEYKSWFEGQKAGGVKKSYVNELLTSLKDGNNKTSSGDLLPSGKNIEKLHTKFNEELDLKTTSGGKMSKAKRTKAKKTRSKRSKKKGKRTRRTNKK
jgi:hypothetical protein